MLGDYGAFRDLQRHRLLTIEWQRLTPHHGYVMPELVAEAGVGEQFQEAMARSGALYDSLLPDYPEQAPYAISMAYRLRYSMQFNAREAIHMLELRSAPQGHPAYRRVVLEMHRHVVLMDAVLVEFSDLVCDSLRADLLVHISAECRRVAGVAPCCRDGCALPNCHPISKRHKLTMIGARAGGQA